MNKWNIHKQQVLNKHIEQRDVCCSNLALSMRQHLSEFDCLILLEFGSSKVTSKVTTSYPWSEKSAENTFATFISGHSCTERKQNAESHCSEKSGKGPSMLRLKYVYQIFIIVILKTYKAKFQVISYLCIDMYIYTYSVYFLRCLGMSV